MQWIFIHKSLFMITLIAGTLLSPLTRAQSFKDTAATHSWDIAGDLNAGAAPGIGVASITITHDDNGAKGTMTIEASSAVAPLLGMTLAERFLRRFPHSPRTFFAFALGASLGTALATGALALQQRHKYSANDHFPPTELHPGTLGNGRAAILDVLIQMALPVLLPGPGAVASYFLKRIPIPRQAKTAFFRPTLFPSPTVKQHFILGFWLVEAHF
ncbi:MAG: hypothetical protein JXR76_02125 [Deltaproteobacteria bacterium]|nr:hypothetical protein [Deltaproteobacteria bacterium]